jgi:hypothetical protein
VTAAMTRAGLARVAWASLLIGAMCGGPRAAYSDTGGGTPREPTTQCKVAVVNPVSGNAECVEPDAPPSSRVEDVGGMNSDLRLETRPGAT